MRSIYLLRQCSLTLIISIRDACWCLYLHHKCYLKNVTKNNYRKSVDIMFLYYKNGKVIIQTFPNTNQRNITELY